MLMSTKIQKSRISNFIGYLAYLLNMYHVDNPDYGSLRYPGDGSIDEDFEQVELMVDIKVKDKTRNEFIDYVKDYKIREYPQLKEWLEFENDVMNQTEEEKLSVQFWRTQAVFEGLLKRNRKLRNQLQLIEAYKTDYMNLTLEEFKEKFWKVIRNNKKEN